MAHDVPLPLEKSSAICKVGATMVDKRGEDAPGFRALGFDTEVGAISRVSGMEYLVSEAAVRGFLLFGPYLLLGEGSYTVSFQLGFEGERDARPAFQIDVCARGGQHILADRTVRGAELVGDSVVSLVFRIDAPEFVEFRVLTCGAGRAWLSRLPDVTMSAADEGSTRLDLASPEIRFRVRNMRVLRSWSDRGASFRFAGADLVVTLHEISFSVEKQEDLQLVDEVIFNNEYGVESNGEKMAIDIGMNCGLTSLYFAKQPSIMEVHGFEPFGGPYRRACRNLEFNPTLASKITMHPYGLAGATERRIVTANADETIGTSIKGAKNGQLEEIQLMSADEALAPILRKAREKGLFVVLKIDCEGSEFSIIDTLNAASLLPLIDVIMMEWHKWWSKDLTQRDLIKPLLASNFIVLDRTSVHNPHAGMIFATRRDRAALMPAQSLHA